MAKRLFDLLLSLIGLIVLLPLFLVVALAIKLDSPGSVFFRGERVGRDGRVFCIFKFRTMVPDARRRGPGITASEDTRITRVGHFLRDYKLDELPQLLNVVRGEMSLVGPRPEDPFYVKCYSPMQRNVLTVRPGITSPASLRYRHEEKLLKGPNWEKAYIEDLMPRKLELELEYIRHHNLWTDIRLILQTLMAMFR